VTPEAERLREAIGTAANEAENAFLDGLPDGEASDRAIQIVVAAIVTELGITDEMVEGTAGKNMGQWSVERFRRLMDETSRALSVLLEVSRQP